MKTRNNQNNHQVKEGFWVRFKALADRLPLLGAIISLMSRARKRPEWSRYDLMVVQEMAEHLTSPGLVEGALDKMSWPMRKAFEKMNGSNHAIVRKAAGLIQEKITNCLIVTTKGARYLVPEEGILRKYRKNQIAVNSLSDIQEKAPLELKDTFARSTRFTNGALITAEGLLAGIGTTLSADTLAPVIIVADVVASMTMLVRETCQIAAIYGYPASDPANIAHIISAMAPIYDKKKGFIVYKRALYQEIRDSLLFIERSGNQIGPEVLEKDAPALMRLIINVTERLGITLSEKELAILIPVLGAMLNGALNLAFQRIGHRNAMDYFRFRDLCARYGEREVKAKMQTLIRSKQN